MHHLKTFPQHTGNRSAFICFVIKLAVAHSIVSNESISSHFTFSLYTGYILSHKADINSLFPLLQSTPWELTHLYTKATLSLVSKVQNTVRELSFLPPLKEKNKSGKHKEKDFQSFL